MFIFSAIVPKYPISIVTIIFKVYIDSSVLTIYFSNTYSCLLALKYSSIRHFEKYILTTFLTFVLVFISLFISNINVLFCFLRNIFISMYEEIVVWSMEIAVLYSRVKISGLISFASNEANSFFKWEIYFSTLVRWSVVFSRSEERRVGKEC